MITRGVISDTIGMFPAIETSDLEALTASIDWLIENAEGVRA